jgi:hypothetical protein
LEHHKIVSAAKGVEFVGDRMSYVVLRVCLCNTFVLNMYVYAPSEDKSDDSKETFVGN